MSKTIRTLFRLGKTNFKLAYAWMQVWVYLLNLVFRPVAQVVFFGVMARFVTGRSDVSFWVVGNALQACVLASLYPVGETLVSERSNGTLSLVVASPLNKLLLFAGRSWLHGLHGVVVSLVSLVLGAWTFGMDFGLVSWGPLSCAVLASVISVSALGMAIGSLGLLTTDINMIGNIAAGLLLVLAGVNFPITSLPSWLQGVSFILPLTRGVAAARLSVAGGGGPILSLCLGEVCVALGWLGLGYLAFRWIESRARKTGSFDLY